MIPRIFTVAILAAAVSAAWAAPAFAELLKKNEGDNNASIRESSFDLESYAFRARLFLDRKNLAALFTQTYDAGYLN